MMIPKEIDGVPITKPYGLRERSYIKGWEARQGEIENLKECIIRSLDIVKQLMDEKVERLNHIRDQALTGKE